MPVLLEQCLTREGIELSKRLQSCHLATPATAMTPSIAAMSPNSEINILTVIRNHRSYFNLSY